MNYLLKENETAIEFATRLQAELDNFKVELNKIKDMDQLTQMETECQVRLEEYDNYIKEVIYKLPASVTFDGKKYMRSKVASMIVNFLNKVEVKWDYTLGLYELSKIWRNEETKTLTFGQMDSTLRCLDQVMFKGFSEWSDILVINEYFKANHEEFSIDTATHIYLSQMHNAVLERIELVKAVNSTEENI